MYFHAIIFTFIAFENGAQCANQIDPDFMKWIKTNLGTKESAKMVRNELKTGSFGGGKLAKPTTYRPVILVNGLNGEAGMFLNNRDNFTANGFLKQYIFATTWGPGASKPDLNSNVTLQCSFAQHTRRFIKIVKNYTKAAQVDVIAYSMGSPIARKALLGGKCVDSATNLGAPLTSSIHTFVSVGGANNGAILCAALPTLTGCNMKTGVVCGSAFLNDINSKGNYEATAKKYNLASTGDDIVGYILPCLKKSSEYTGAKEITLTGKNHEYTLLKTADIQLNMLRGTA